MERAFIIGKFNTFYDWGLILEAKSTPDPDVKTNYVELDGMSGTLDLSESLSGEVVYNDRTVSASFWTCEGNHKSRVALLRTITAVLHGRKVKIIEPDDPAHYFYGRVKITSTANNRAYATFTLEATCDPWRYALEESVRRVDVNNDTVNIVIRNNGVKTVCPEITITGAVDITVDGVTTSLTEGTYKITDLKLKAGPNVIGVTGKGSATFTYREADL